ncbi:uncharacterized protein PRCAT00001300001 [Priceomyces carsonii]|uniref:uncharacterized protein n=1 Tax=Priceomyces carsonii TaxID=28549 RepID=UPI002ED91AC4|nr:unnamed protein product [Priceomyces carsonii]
MMKPFITRRSVLGLSNRVKRRATDSSLVSRRLHQVNFSRNFHELPNKSSTMIRNVNNIPETGSALVPGTASTPTLPTLDGGDSKTFKIDSEAQYLKTLPSTELLSNLIIGIATINKPILDFCIKLFPYVPLSIIKVLVYKLYCGGETMNEVRQTGARLYEKGINNMMLSLTIEACEGNDNVDPDYIVSETIKSIEEIMVPHTLSVIKNSGKDINSIPPAYVALKPTGFAKDAANVLKNFKSDPEYAKQFEALVEKASSICQSIYDNNVRLAQIYPERVAPFVVGVIDAEKYELQEGVYELQRRLYSKFNPVNKPVSIVGTLQMYLSQSADLLALEERLATENGYRLGLKLVRGAYIHSERDRNTIIHKSKEDTDVNYNQGIEYVLESILASGGNDSTIGHLVVASHNAESLKLATEKLYHNSKHAQNSNKNNVVLGQLLGMADGITYSLIKNYNIDNVIKYVPWGPPLESKKYLLRRLEENGDAVKADNGLPLVKAVTNILFKRLFKFV